jgi:hypothetical protein
MQSHGDCIHLQITTMHLSKQACLATDCTADDVLSAFASQLKERDSNMRRTANSTEITNNKKKKS